MSPTVYVITGGSRGIGFHIVQELSARADVIVYAGVRSFPASPNSPLGQLVAKLPKVVIPIKITSGDEAENKAAAALVKAQVGKVHVVIANAGGPTQYGTITTADVTLANLHDDFTLNTVGPVVLYQAFRPLLVAASGDAPLAKFVVVSSIAGQIADAPPYSLAAYGASKSAVNYLTKKIDQESPELVAFPINPGFVITDSSKEFSASIGVTDLSVLGAITAVESAKGILGVIDKATKESHGGKFWDVTGVQHTY